MKSSPSVVRRQGVALVLVLAFLALISVFVVGFFSSASGELKSSTSYAASATTKQLAESATNIVMAQIRAGTTRVANNAADRRRDFDSWASQPGMIRTFAGGVGNGTVAATALYKLYSSDQMIIDTDTGSFRGSKDVPTGPSGWQSQPALYTDLNEPVLMPDGVTLRYPVFDPTVFTKYSSWNEYMSRPSPPTSTTDEKSPLEGAGVITDTSLPANQANSRMPVKWLYTLKDGSVVAPLPNSGNNHTANFSPNGIHPTQDNPIVGRIAFWGDDDTSKVNINTAGGYVPPKANSASTAGAFWDTPRLATTFDIGNPDPSQPDKLTGGLSASQPAAGEFQRFPGHPATTSLGVVFPYFTSEQLYTLTPRIAGGGSKGGIIQTKSEVDLALKQRYDRLYSSVDELLYMFDPSMDNPDPKFGLSVAPVQRIRQDNATSPTHFLTPARLEQLRFFLTAHSRAPELNLFGRPRITLWPVWPIFGAKGADRFTHAEYLPNSYVNTLKPYSRDDFRALCNTEDKLIAFCSTIGSGLDDPSAKPYIFQRYDPYSSTNDALIPRNARLLQILQEETKLPVPGYGADFKSTRFGDDMDQVLAEMFDYIRCINLNDSTHDTVPQYPPSGPVVPIPMNTFKYAPHAIVVPSVVPALSKSTGFGRFPTISEVAIDFYHAGYLVHDTPSKDNKITKDVFRYMFDRTLAHQYIDEKGAKGSKVVGKMIAAFLVLETFNPMQGFATLSGFDHTNESVRNKTYFIHHVTGLDQFKISTASLGDQMTSLQFPADASNAYDHAPGDVWGGRNFGGTEGFMHTMIESTSQYSDANPGSPLAAMNTPTRTNWYPFRSTPSKTAGFPPSPLVLKGDGTEPIVLPPPIVNPITHKSQSGYPMHGVLVRQEDKTFRFSGGKINIELKWGQQPADVINRYTVNFPGSAGDWPIPTDNIWYGGNGADGTNWDCGGFPQGLGGLSVNPSLIGDSADPRDLGWRKAMEVSEDSPLIAIPDFQFSMDGRIRWCRIGGSTSSYNPSNIKTGGDGMFYQRRWRQIVQPGDTIRSMLPSNPDAPASGSGGIVPAADPRVLALFGPNTPTNLVKYFAPHPYYQFYTGKDPYTPQNKPVRHAETLRNADGSYFIYRDLNNATTAQTSRALEDDSKQNPFAPAGSIYFPNDYTKYGNMVQDAKYSLTTSATLPPLVNGVKRADGTPGDFDAGTGKAPDGAYANKVDEGAYAWKYWDSNNHIYTYGSPYYPPNGQTQSAYASHFSPNRQISSAVAFGSLPAGRKKHWETLAFSPNPASRTHPGINPRLPDHLLLDLFTMPVVEPYAISEPFSTAGKINLNYAMEPFSYIRRTTAVRAALQSLRVTAIQPTMAQAYKTQTPLNFRYLVDRDLTIGLMEKVFYGANGTGDSIFKSATQICEQFLVPQGASQPVPATSASEITTSIMKSWWTGMSLTADNMREKPYGDLYPRITTKSNTFTVYMRVQVLRKAPLVGNKSAVATANLTWNEDTDQVLSEYRGYTTIERYLDPADPRITGPSPESRSDGADPDKHSLESVYKFRVVESKRFQR